MARITELLHAGPTSSTTAATLTSLRTLSKILLSLALRNISGKLLQAWRGSAAIRHVQPLEERVLQDHPLRAVRRSVDEVLRKMAKDFDGMYAKTGRPSVPPERLLRAVLLQIFYSVRGERLRMEQLNYNLLFRWFVGLEMDEPVGTTAVFRKNRERLLDQEVAREFFSGCWRKLSRIARTNISVGMVR